MNTFCIQHIKHVALITIFCFLGFSSAWGQVANYTFSQSTGTYSAITSGNSTGFATVHSSGWDDPTVGTGTIPFTFNFNGTGYTSCRIPGNGFITFGATAPGTTQYTPLSDNTAYAGAVAALARDLVSNASTIVTGTQGTSPNRVFIIQWNNAYRFSGSAIAANYNFQIRLSETTNQIQVIYGSCASSSTSLAVQVGLRGANNSDYNNRGGNWNASTTGLSNAATMTTHNTANITIPSNGLTYTWAPCTASTAPTGINPTTASVCSGSSITLTSSGGSLGSGAVDVWYAGACGTETFSQNWNLQPYTTAQTTVNSINNGILNLTSTGTDPWLEMYNIGSFGTLSTNRFINIRYRVISGTPGTAEIFFLSASNPGAAQVRAVAGNLITGGQWQVLSIDMGSNANWTAIGNITGWRFDWAGANTVNMELDFISLGSQPMIGSGPSISVSPTFATTYHTAKKGSCGLTACVSRNVTITTPPTPSFTAQPSASICAGVNTTYTTQASQTNYTWGIPGTAGTDYIITSGGTTSDNSLGITWLTASASRVVTINYTNAGGCAAASATSSTATTVNTPPTGVSAAATTNPICVGQTLALNGTATGATTWAWTGPNGFTSAIEDPSIANATAAANGNYILTASNACGDGGVVDDFSDGNFTINRVWTPQTGTYASGVNFLQPNDISLTDERISTRSTQAYGSWQFDFTLAATGNGADVVRYHLLSSNAALFAGSNGYFIRASGLGANGIQLFRLDNGTPSSLALASFNYTPTTASRTIRVTRLSSGVFEIFLDNVSLGTATDNTYTTSSFNGVWTSANAPTVSHIVDNINCVSRVSTNVSVQSISAAPSITGTYCPGATTVNGTGIDGATINVIRSSVSIGTATVSGGVWSATVSALSAGNVITATQTVSGQCVSAASASIIVNPIATAGTIQNTSNVQITSGSSINICVGNGITANNLASPTNGGSGNLTVVWYCGELISGLPGSGSYGNWVRSTTAATALLNATGTNVTSLTNYNPQGDFPGKTNFYIIRRAFTDLCGEGVNGNWIDQFFYLNILPNHTIATGVNTTTCINSAITTINLATTNATGATFSGLPAGLASGWAGNVATISGTPTVSGTFNYSVTTTGTCTPAVANGTITVNPLATAGSIQHHGTTQTICVGATISSNSLVNTTNGGAGTLTTVWYVGEDLGSGTWGNWRESTLGGISGTTSSSALNTAAGGGSGTGQSLSTYNPQVDFPGKTRFLIIRRGYNSNCGPCVGGCQDQSFVLDLITGPSAIAATPTPANAATGVCYAGTGAVSSISWAAVAGATGYDVFFGTSNPPTSLVSSNQAGLSYSIGTLSANTTYFWRIAPRNSCGANNSGTVWSFTTAITPCGYCVPTYSQGCNNTVDVVTRVRLGTLDNTSTWGTTCPTRYVDYTASISAPILIPGLTYQLLITVGNDADNFTAAWFDWNGDGDFADANEYYNGGDPNANGTATINVTVPSNAFGGNIRMRVRGGEDSNINLQSHACGASPSGFGEAEDYVIRITTPDYRVEWVSMSYGTANWCVGDQRPVSVTLKNVGAKTWNTDFTTNVGVKWNANGGNWGDYHLRVSAGSLAPGQTQTYNFTLPALNATAGPSYGGDLPLGANNISFDIVNEGNCWFGGNGGACGPGNVVYTSPTIQIQPKPIANAGQDKLLPCSGSGIVLDGSSNNETIFTEDFGNGTPQELTNSTSAWRIAYRVGSHPANRTKWWIHNNATSFPCVTSGSALLMEDPLIANQCDYAWDDGDMDEVAYNTNLIDGRLYTSLNLAFDFRASGERSGTTVYDYFQVVYSLDNGASWITVNTGNNGTGYTFTSNNGINNGFFTTATTPSRPNNAPATGRHSVDLSFLAGQTFLIGYRWYNDGATGNYSNLFIDNIAVTGAASYSWSPTAGVTGNLTKSPTMTQANTYTLVVTAGNGCTASDQAIVTNTTIPAVPSASNTGPVCIGSTFNLSAQGLAPGGKVINLTGTNTISSGVSPSISNNFTMEFWVNPSKTRVTSTEVSTGVSTNTASSTDQSFAIYPDQRGAVASGAGVSVGIDGISVFEHGDGYLPSTLVYNATISGWNHIAVVYTNRVPSLYLNGNLVKTGVISGRATVHPSLGTGLAYGFFNGSMDNLRVWNTARTAAEIIANMFLETPSTTPAYLFSYDNSNCVADIGGVTNTATGVTYPDATYYTYTWSGASGLPSPAANTSEVRTPAVLAAATYNYTVTPSSGVCAGTGAATQAEVKANNQTASSWLGSASGSTPTDWFDGKNWSNCVPGNQTIVTIPRARPSYPVVVNTSTFDTANPKGRARAKRITMDTSGSGTVPTLNVNTSSELRVNE